MIVVTTAEAADSVGVDPFTIRQWVARGYLRPLRAGAKPLMFRETDVVECSLGRTSKAQHARLDRLWAQVLAEERAICHDGS